METLQVGGQQRRKRQKRVAGEPSPNRKTGGSNPTHSSPTPPPPSPSDNNSSNRPSLLASSTELLALEERIEEIQKSHDTIGKNLDRMEEVLQKEGFVEIPRLGSPFEMVKNARGTKRSSEELPDDMPPPKRYSPTPTEPATTDLHLSQHSERTYCWGRDRGDSEKPRKRRISKVDR